MTQATLTRPWVRPKHLEVLDMATVHRAARNVHRDKQAKNVNGRQPNDDNPQTRIGRNIQVQANGCWLYGGRQDRYGRAILNGKSVAVHRFVYEVLVGEIPEGHHVHHECETPACCNPAHLIALTPAEHGQRHAEMRRAG